jgi:predicted permease
MLLQNLRFAWRGLRTNPGYAVSAILALGVGIGLNTAMFSVIDGILLKPLPFERPEELYTFKEQWLTRGGSGFPLSAGNYYEYRERAKSVKIGVYGSSPFALQMGEGNPERIVGAAVSEDWFDVFRLKLAKGRGLMASDFEPGRDEAVVIAHSVWQEKFGGAESAIGQVLQLNGKPRRIVGVLEKSLEFPGRSKILAPLVLEGEAKTRRQFHGYWGYARVNPGFSVAQARGELEGMLQQMAQVYPENNSNKRVMLTPLDQEISGRLKPALYSLVGAVAFVLAIACANVANLLLARGAVRHQELAVRTALGASRGTIVGQLMTESLLLSAFGGLAGIVFAYAAFAAFKLFAPQNLPRMDQVAMDERVFLYNLLAVIVTGVLFGAIPAWKLSKIDLHSTLKEKSRGGSVKAKFRNLLVVAQVAAALMLMTGAGLLIRSLGKLADVDLGFTAEHLLTMRVTPLPTKYDGNTAMQIQFGQNLVRNVAGVPGVKVAAISTDVPLLGSNPRFMMRRDIWPAKPTAKLPIVDYFAVSPGFIEAFGGKLKEGRTFTDADGEDSQKVAIVNESFVKKHFPGESAVGKRLDIGVADPPSWSVIVGVMSDMKIDGVDSPAPPQAFAPFWQTPGIIGTNAATFSVLARTTGDPAAMAAAVKAKVLETDKAQPVYQVQTMEETVSNSLSREKFTLFLMGVFACVAFLLAIVGLSGVVAYTVAQRTREIGIRMAIGARPADVLMMVEGQALLLVGAGIIAGVIGSLFVARSIEKLLYEVSPFDPVTFVVIALVFLVTAMVSGLLPAVRASRIDPAVTLRAE